MSISLKPFPGKLVLLSMADPIEDAHRKQEEAAEEESRAKSEAADAAEAQAAAKREEAEELRRQSED